VTNQTTLSTRFAALKTHFSDSLGEFATWSRKLLKKYGPAAFQVALIFGARSAMADGGDELGGGICNVVNLLMGKWVFGSALGAMIASGTALLFGAELTEMLKRTLTIVAGVGFIVSFGGLLTLAYSKLSSAGC
jgi:hypothetical protein